MSLTSTLSVATSGLKAAQRGLTTTGHNISNTETKGYTRQQNIQMDSSYSTIGSSKVGSGLLQVGLGSDISAVRQIRNKFFDMAYREANSTGNFYAAKFNTGYEVENILGELESSFKAQDVISDVWDAINELTLNPTAIETRDNFIETCVTFMEKMKDVSDNLVKYQMNLNEQIIGNVNKVNDYVSQVNELNLKITKAEANGDRANDYRDQRNYLLDQLSGLIDINIKESGSDGRVDILLNNGNELLSDGFQSVIGLRYASPSFPFVEPVFTQEKGILEAGVNASPLYPNLDNENLTGASGNSKGELKGLLISRGNVVADYTTTDSEVNNYFIPNLQKKLDTLFNAVVTLINDAVCPKEGELPYNLKGEQEACEVFSRFKGYIGEKPTLLDRETVEEDLSNVSTLYSIRNVVINPKLLNTDGYNYLAFSRSGMPNDTEMLNEISQEWKTGLKALGGASIDKYYKNMITDLAVEIEEAKTFSDTSSGRIDIIENDRMALSGVSLDEEMTNMLKYQHAYNSAAKVISVINDMLETIVNGIKR